MSYEQDLKDAAAVAGLKDLELLKVVRPGLRADVAVADLRQRYPSAFDRPKQAKDMTPKELEDGARRLGIKLRSR